MDAPGCWKRVVVYHKFRLSIEAMMLVSPNIALQCFYMALLGLDRASSHQSNPEAWEVSDAIDIYT
jgi:hypothetical protein